MACLHVVYAHCLWIQSVTILGFADIVPGQFVLILAIGEHLQCFLPLGVHAGGYQNYNRGHKARVVVHILWVSRFLCFGLSHMGSSLVLVLFHVILTYR